MKAGKRTLRNGAAYDAFFQPSEVKTTVVKKEALISDTVDVMQRVIAQTLSQTKAIAKHLQADSVRATCQRIWEFCYNHIQYEKDELRTEQIRTPARAWHDRESGIDCDCFTVLIGSILSNLKIPFVMRLWRDKAANYEHIYPVAFTPKGKEIIMDCVIDQFDQEAPYTQIKDIEMELQILSGIEQQRFNEFGDRVTYETDLPIDAEDLNLYDEDIELDGLAGRAERLARQAKRKEKKAVRKQTPLKERVKQKVKNFGKKLNKVNPVTALMRAGILASMKLNILQVGSKIRFAYWTPQQASSRNMNMAKYAQIQQIRAKIEKVYGKLGGDVNALKKAILSGKGNRNQMVQLNGLGAMSVMPSEYDDIVSVLGHEIISDDLAESGILENGVSGLGSVTLSAAVAAAAGFIGKIAAMFKKIGGVFKKGSREDSQFQIQENTEAEEEKTNRFNFKNLRKLTQLKRTGEVLSTKSPSTYTGDDEQYEEDSESYDYDESFDSSAKSTEEMDDLESMDTSELEETDISDEAAAKGEPKKGVIEWVKANPLATGGIALAAGGLLYLAFRKKKKPTTINGLSGVKKSKRKKKKAPASRTSAATKPRKRKTTKRRKPAIKRKRSTPRIKRVELS